MKSLPGRIRKLEDRAVAPDVLAEAIRRYGADGNLPRQQRIADRVVDYWRRVDAHFAEQDAMAMNPVKGDDHDP